jgi:hypothetical protein
LKEGYRTNCHMRVSKRITAGPAGYFDPPSPAVVSRIQHLQNDWVLLCFFDLYFHCSSDVSKHLHRYRELSERLNRFRYLNLTLVKLKLLRVQSIRDLAGVHRSEHLIVLARLARQLSVTPFSNATCFCSASSSVAVFIASEVRIRSMAFKLPLESSRRGRPLHKGRSNRITMPERWKKCGKSGSFCVTRGQNGLPQGSSASRKGISGMPGEVNGGRPRRRIDWDEMVNGEEDS